MKGSMMDYPLTLQSILERIPKTYPKVEIVSRRADGGLHRYSYLDFYGRAKALAEALHRAGLQPGDRVGTLCWNHSAHLEAYFGVPSAGGVVHTLNLRLHPQELAFIVNHAQDRFLIVDDVLLPLFEQFRDKVKPERVFIVSQQKQALASGMESYEELLASASGDYEFPRADENDAAQCASHQAQPATPRACSTRTVRLFCMRWLFLCRTHSVFLSMTFVWH